MFKRFAAMFLVLILLVGMMAVPVAAKERDEAAIETEAWNVVKRQAAAVYRANADDDALSQFFKHGFFGNGAKRTFTDSDPFISSLWNSCQFQEALAVGIAGGITQMQKFGLDHLYVHGGPSWHQFFYAYGYSGHTTDYYDPFCVIDSITNVGDGYNVVYDGPRNENDTVMELLVGGIGAAFTLDVVERKEHSVVYSINLKCEDEFEFVGNYDKVAEKGYDTSSDEMLNNLAFLMTYVGLNEFYWEYNKTLQIEVPYKCDHGAHNYSWIYDRDALCFINDTSGEYTANEPTQRIYDYVDKTDATKNQTIYYYELENSVVLHHDEPWVLEYDQLGLQYFYLSPIERSWTCLNRLYLAGGNYIWIAATGSEKVPEGSNIESHNGYISRTDCVGVELTGKFKYNSKHTYTTRLENVVNADGSNMIYASIYDHDLDEVVFGPEPMDDYWAKTAVDKSYTLVDTTSDRVNGMELVINYLGTKGMSIGNGNTHLDIRVYEGGMEPEQGTYREATCTKQGGNVFRCKDCGAEYVTEAEAALGHDYGEYTSEDNATCTADGAKTRICNRCGEKDTVADVGTALGHDFNNFSFDGNATCVADGTQTCSCVRCGVTDTVTAPDTATGHSYTAKVTEPTCVKDGYTTYTCHCGDTYVAEETEATGHSHDAVVTEATCTAQGYTSFSCVRCGDGYVSDYTELAEHTVVVDPAVAPTCVSKGLTEGSHCGVCGLVLKKQAAISQVKDHTMDKGVVVKEATSTAGGMMLYTCIHCGKESYVSTPALLEPEVVNNPFTDVSESDWFYAPVLWAVSNNVTTGKTATTFAPNERCTRSQVVTFLWAAAGRPEPKSMDNPFVDVANDAWYLKPVLWAVEQGITGGIGGGRFGPDEPCNRAQIATFLWAAKGKQAVDDLNGFSDVNASDWYATAIGWAKENGITDGIGDGKFGPMNPCTRAQVVTFLKKAYE